MSFFCCPPPRPEWVSPLVILKISLKGWARGVQEGLEGRRRPPPIMANYKPKYKLLH